MRHKKFWAGYLVIVLLLLGIVYIATGSLQDTPAPLSVSVMQQLKGSTWYTNHYCKDTTACPYYVCNVQNHIYMDSTPLVIKRCSTGTTKSCQDDSGSENVAYCRIKNYDMYCQNPAPTNTQYTYPCSDQ